MFAMNAPWMNTAGSPVPETSYSSLAPSRLALSNAASLSAPRRHRGIAAEAYSSAPFYAGLCLQPPMVAWACTGPSSLLLCAAVSNMSTAPFTWNSL
jgi:hypothetical protein